MTKSGEYERPRPLAMEAFASVPSEHRFNSVDQIQGEIVGQLPEIAQEYLQGAFAYFANHTDLYLRELGNLGKAFFDPEVEYPGCGLEIKIAPSVPDGLNSLPISDEDRESMRDEKIAVIGLRPPKQIVWVMSYDFFTAANDPKQRIDLLGDFVANLSQVESALNDVTSVPVVGVRSMLTEAHFYNRVRQEPGVKLSGQAQERWARFPQGIFSPNIPQAGRPPHYWKLN